MASSRLQAGALLVLFGGLALLSSTAMLGIFLFQGFFGFGSPPGGALFVGIVLFLGGLTVAVLGGGVFMWGFANRPPGE